MVAASLPVFAHRQPKSPHAITMWCASFGTEQLASMHWASPESCITSDSWQCSMSSLHQRHRTELSSATITETFPAGAVSRVRAGAGRRMAWRPDFLSFMTTTVGAARDIYIATRPTERLTRDAEPLAHLAKSGPVRCAGCRAVA
jgi:hypothetical protein